MALDTKSIQEGVVALWNQLDAVNKAILHYFPNPESEKYQRTLRRLIPLTLSHNEEVIQYAALLVSKSPQLDVEAMSEDRTDLLTAVVTLWQQLEGAADVFDMAFEAEDTRKDTPEVRALLSKSKEVLELHNTKRYLYPDVVRA